MGSLLSAKPTNGSIVWPLFFLWFNRIIKSLKARETVCVTLSLAVSMSLITCYTALLYPNGVSGSSWLYQGPDYYGMTISMSPIFANVPGTKFNATAVPCLQGECTLFYELPINELVLGNYLAPVGDTQDEIRRCNRDALEVTNDNGMLPLCLFDLVLPNRCSAQDLSLLANWPDPDSHIRNLANTVYLGAVRVTEPDIFDALGARIHPSAYSHHLVPGTRVAVQAIHKL